MCISPDMLGCVASGMRKVRRPCLKGANEAIKGMHGSALQVGVCESRGDGDEEGRRGQRARLGHISWEGRRVGGKESEAGRA